MRGQLADDATSVTLLEAKHRRRQCKSIELDGDTLLVRGHEKSAYYKFSSLSLDDQGHWLRKLQDRRDCCVVLGAATDVVNAGLYYRRRSQDRDGQAATLRDTPRGWMPFDIDSLPFTPTSSMPFTSELLSVA